MEKYSGILSKGFIIDQNYTVLLFIKRGKTAETYRVKSKDGKLYFLKLFYNAKLHATAFNKDGDILEIEHLKQLQHSNIVSFKDSGELINNGKRYGYLILDFIAGETLAQRIAREPISSIYDINQIAIGVLNGLHYLHSLNDPLIHNEITPQNIMLDLSGEVPVPRIIDFGYARSFHQSTKSYNREGINLHYVASECFNNLYSPQSDLFSVGAVIYHLLFGVPPWLSSISKYKADKVKLKEVLSKERKNHPIYSNTEKEVIGFDETIVKILKKSLHNDPDIRFQSAEEFIKAINHEAEVEDVDQIKSRVSEEEVIERSEYSTKPKGGGFDSVTGMEELKNLLTIDVIDALRHPEKYKKYDISFPNGILFFGPPRCGKTFFAKKFAEEVGFNYMYVKPSTLKSKWINATQENIAKMFEEAEKNAPTIIFIDELNELVPCRDSDVHEMSKSAVNEMLAQMDRTGDKGIFVVGATNYPKMIDPAMLGAGRIEKKFYIGPPDLVLRKALFKSYLAKKPLDFGIDYDKLATISKNYVTADIELVINEAAKKAMHDNKRVSMDILEQTIKQYKPTVSLSELNKYEKMRKEIEEEGNNSTTDRPRMGFKFNN